MAHHYRHQILLTLSADGRPIAFRWRESTYRVVEVLSRWHERDRWWMSNASTASATLGKLGTLLPKGPTDRHYYRLLCEDNMLCEVYYDDATTTWVLDRVLD